MSGQLKICFIGKAGSGKDFLAKYMIKHHYFFRYAFADEVKAVAHKYFPDLYGEGEDSKPRALLQDVGQKFRSIDTNVWIRTLFAIMEWDMEQAARYRHAVPNIIITDCRMPNEYEALKKKGFIFIRIDIDDDTRLQRLRDRGDVFLEDDLKHDTESHYDSFSVDYTIVNNGSPDEVYEKLYKILKDIDGGEKT